MHKFIDSIRSSSFTSSPDSLLSSSPRQSKLRTEASSTANKDSPLSSAVSKSNMDVSLSSHADSILSSQPSSLLPSSPAKNQSPNTKSLGKKIPFSSASIGGLKDWLKSPSKLGKSKLDKSTGDDISVQAEDLSSSNLKMKSNKQKRGKRSTSSTMSDGTDNDSDDDHFLSKRVRKPRNSENNSVEANKTVDANKLLALLDEDEDGSNGSKSDNDEENEDDTSNSGFRVDKLVRSSLDGRKKRQPKGVDFIARSSRINMQQTSSRDTVDPSQLQKVLHSMRESISSEDTTGVLQAGKLGTVREEDEDDLGDEEGKGDRSVSARMDIAENEEDNNDGNNRSQYNEAVPSIEKAVASLQASLDKINSSKDHSPRNLPTPLKSCVIKNTDRKKVSLSASKTVKFGSPKAVEYDVDDPVRNGLTPLAPDQAKSLYKMIGDDDDEANAHQRSIVSLSPLDLDQFDDPVAQQMEKDTEINSRILAELEAQENNDEDDDNNNGDEQNGTANKRRRNSKSRQRRPSRLSLGVGSSRNKNRRSSIGAASSKRDYPSVFNSFDEDEDSNQHEKRNGNYESAEMNNASEMHKPSDIENSVVGDNESEHRPMNLFRNSKLVDESNDMEIESDQRLNNDKMQKHVDDSPETLAQNQLMDNTYTMALGTLTDLISNPIVPERKQLVKLELSQDVEDKTIDLGNLSELISDANIVTKTPALQRKMDFSDVQNDSLLDDDDDTLAGNKFKQKMASAIAPTYSQLRQLSTMYQGNNGNMDDNSFDNDKPGSLAQLSQMGSHSIPRPPRFRDSLLDDSSHDLDNDEHTVQLGSLKDLAIGIGSGPTPNPVKTNVPSNLPIPGVAPRPVNATTYFRGEVDEYLNQTVDNTHSIIHGMDIEELAKNHFAMVFDVKLLGLSSAWQLGIPIVTSYILNPTGGAQAEIDKMMKLAKEDITLEDLPIEVIDWACAISPFEMLKQWTSNELSTITSAMFNTIEQEEQQLYNICTGMKQNIASSNVDLESIIMSLTPAAVSGLLLQAEKNIQQEWNTWQKKIYNDLSETLKQNVSYIENDMSVLLREERKLDEAEQLIKKSFEKYELLRKYQDMRVSQQEELENIIDEQEKVQARIEELELAQWNLDQKAKAAREAIESIKSSQLITKSISQVESELTQSLDLLEQVKESVSWNLCTMTSTELCLEYTCSKIGNYDIFLEELSALSPISLSTDASEMALTSMQGNDQNDVSNYPVILRISFNDDQERSKITGVETKLETVTINGKEIIRPLSKRLKLIVDTKIKPEKLGKKLSELPSILKIIEKELHSKHFTSSSSKST